MRSRETKLDGCRRCIDRIRRVVIPGLLLAASLLGCGEDRPEAVISAPPVMLTAVEIRDLVERIEATGQLIPQAAPVSSVADEVV